jgi:hypothetical protein
VAYSAAKVTSRQDLPPCPILRLHHHHLLPAHPYTMQRMAATAPRHNKTHPKDCTHGATLSAWRRWSPQPAKSLPAAPCCCTRTAADTSSSSLRLLPLSHKTMSLPAPALLVGTRTYLYSRLASATVARKPREEAITSWARARAKGLGIRDQCRASVSAQDVVLALRARRDTPGYFSRAIFSVAPNNIQRRCKQACLQRCLYNA